MRTYARRSYRKPYYTPRYGYHNTFRRRNVRNTGVSWRAVNGGTVSLPAVPPQRAFSPWYRVTTNPQFIMPIGNVGHEISISLKDILDRVLVHNPMIVPGPGTAYKVYFKILSVKIWGPANGYLAARFSSSGGDVLEEKEVYGSPSVRPSIGFKWPVDDRGPYEWTGALTSEVVHINMQISDAQNAATGVAPAVVVRDGWSCACLATILFKCSPNGVSLENRLKKVRINV